MDFDSYYCVRCIMTMGWSETTKRATEWETTICVCFIFCWTNWCLNAYSVLGVCVCVCVCVCSTVSNFYLNSFSIPFRLNGKQNTMHHHAFMHSFEFKFFFPFFLNYYFVRFLFLFWNECRQKYEHTSIADMSGSISLPPFEWLWLKLNGLCFLALMFR